MQKEENTYTTEQYVQRLVEIDRKNEIINRQAARIQELEKALTEKR